MISSRRFVSGPPFAFLAFPKDWMLTFFLFFRLVIAIVGGLLLVVNLGPGGFSVDEKKKNY